MTGHAAGRPGPTDAAASGAAGPGTAGASARRGAAGERDAPPGPHAGGAPGGGWARSRGTHPAAAGHRCRLTGTVRVGLPPAEAFRLFTPLGERDWAPGWEPVFPAPGDDDTEPGTVFQIATHGRVTTWVVLDREPGRRISYARLTPGERAGTVSVCLDPAGDAASRATVTYDLTALTAAAAAELRTFAEGYPDHLRSWEQAIGAALAGPSPDTWHAAR